MGQLQRGLGLGFLSAIDENPGTVEPLLVQCIQDDPRWDHQVDHRGDYYAQLFLAKGLDLTPLVLQLENHDDKDESSSDAWLAIDVLGALARRGNQEAVGILRGYVACGYHVRLALWELAETRDPESWAGLDEVVSARFQDPKILSCQLSLNWAPLDNPPWDAWALGPTAVGRILRDRQKGSRAQSEPSPDPATMTTVELLDRAEQTKSPRTAPGVLAARDSEEDTAILLEAIDESRPWRAIAALQALGQRGDVRVLEPAKGIIERFQWGGWRRRRQPLALRMWASRAIVELPADLVLPLARRWRSSRSWKYRRTAISILERHATVDDIPWLRRQLTRRIGGRVYGLCDYAQILARFPETGPYAALRRIFREFPYSYGRRFYAEAMAATDPSFAGGLAVECLWDCEPSVRLPGVRSVDTSAEGVTERLKDISQDEAEQPDVREAAKSRLATN